MNHDMAAMIILGMKPDLIPACMVPGQRIILQIVLPVGNLHSVTQRDRRDMRTFLGMFLLPFPGLLCGNISAFDQLLLDLFCGIEIGLIQLFEQAGEVADLILRDPDLLLKIFLAFLQLRILRVASAGIAFSVQPCIKRDLHRFIRLIVIQRNGSLSLRIIDLMHIQQLSIPVPLVAVHRFIHLFQ